MIKKWKQFNENSQYPDCVDDTIDFKVLTKLEDERDSIQEGDEVLATYFGGGGPGGFSTYKFVVHKYKFDDLSDLVVYQDGDKNVLGYSSDDAFYGLEEAYHVVKMETYNDFVQPDKILEKSIWSGKSPKTVKTKSNNIPGLLYISTEIRDEVRKHYIDVIDTLFVDLHDKFETVSGDALFTTENLVDDYQNRNDETIIETTTYQIIDNMDISSMAKSIKSDKVDFQILSELKDESNVVDAGDEVIIVTNSPASSLGSIRTLTNKLIKVFVGEVKKTRDSGKLMVVNDDIRFLLEDAMLVVKKETYEDFAGPIKL